MSVSNSTNYYDLGEWTKSNKVYFICTLIIQWGLKIPVRVFGISTNLLALLVFQKCRLRDGISVCFMVLTLSDGICLLTFLLGSLMGLLDMELQVRPYISLFYVSYILTFYGVMFYNISTMITVFLAIQKCCCISLPWNFKSYFSKRRCVAAVCCIYLSGFILYIPFTATAFPFVEAFDLTTNSTRLTFAWSTIYLNEVFPVLKAINYISLPLIAEVLVLISSLILSAKLNESIKFRNSLSGDSMIDSHSKQKNESSKLSLAKMDSNNTVINIEPQKVNTVKSSIQPMSRKELRATQAVNVVAILFVIANTPDVILFLVSLLEPEFSALGSYYDLFRVCVELEDFLHVINLSVNLFVYLKFNTRFAETFKSFILRRLKNN
ncbi:adenosine receptor A1 [Biomphalaria glabrata]|nr:adenosine receptor A1 [Biomphalaria glabrata]